MILSESQQAFINQVLNTSKRIITLQGEAGSGKTTALIELIKQYKGSVLITATTNKAKTILKQKLLEVGLSNDVYTTHSALGFRMCRNGIEEYLSDMNEAKKADLLIIDEMSMLPNKVYSKAITEPFKQILLVGDDLQLEAIGLKAKVESDIIITLKEQHRQDANNSKLKDYLLNLRESIITKRLPKLTEGTPSNILVYTSHKDFCKAYLDCYKPKRILCYSNKVVDSYNLNINDGLKFKDGDYLILDKPLGQLKNNSLVYVLEVIEHLDHYDLLITDENEVYQIKVFKSKTKEEQYFTKVLKDKPNNYWSIKDMYFKPKHVFASTIHKAQGQTLDEVFIDLTDVYSQLVRKPTKWNNYNKPISVQSYIKLVYVAISRMKEKAHLFIGDKREYKYLRSK